MGKILLTLDFSFMKYNQGALMQSLIKDKSFFFLEKLGILDGLHISAWIKEKGLMDLVFLNRKKVWWCLVSWQLSQWKSLTLTF